MKDRYLAKFTTVPAMFHSGWRTGWIVVDTKAFDWRGRELAIALCTDQAQAQKITLSLNQAQTQDQSSES